MSGGSFNYLYSKSVSELLEDSDALKELQYLGAELRESYGPQSEAVVALTSSLHEDIVKLREEIERRAVELEKRFERARKVYREVEYCCSLDGSPESVHKALAAFNESLKS